MSAGKVRGIEMVEPEDAGDAAGAVVDGEFEEFVGFEIAGSDDADRLEARKEDAFARERDGIGEGGGLSEREEVESQELYVGVAETVVHRTSNPAFRDTNTLDLVRQDPWSFWSTFGGKHPFLSSFFSLFFF